MARHRVLLTWGVVAAIAWSGAGFPVRPMHAMPLPSVPSDSTALVAARGIVREIDRRLDSMRVEPRELPGSARENARLMGFVDGTAVRHISVVYTGIGVNGFERFWFRNDSLVQATRIIERLDDPQRQRVIMRVEHELLFRGDSLLGLTTRVTTGSGDPGTPPGGGELRRRAARLLRCVQAPPRDERACTGF